MSKTKILAIGDIHIRNSNLQDIDIFMEKIDEHVLSQHTFDHIILLGDILHDHERLHTTPMNKALDVIRTLKDHAHLYILVGNHDMINHQQFLSDKHWMNALKDWENVTVVDTVIENTDNMIDYTNAITSLKSSSQNNSPNFVMVPYVPNGRFEEALNYKLNESVWMNAKCIFAHQEFKGCKMGALISEHGDDWPETHPQIVSGHIHSNQRPQPNVYYPGSCIQHAFGESFHNVVSIITLGDDPSGIRQQVDTFQIDEIDLHMPRKTTITCNVDSIESIKDKVLNGGSIESNASAYSDTDGELRACDHVRLVIKGTQEEFKTFKKTKLYKTFKKSDVKMVFKSLILDVVDQSAEETCMDACEQFSTVLRELCTKENNEILSELCDEVLQFNLDV